MGQELPFPAVTMNAPVLKHPYRLIESVYNDVKFDCSKHEPSANVTCQACMDETRSIRRDLLPFTQMMFNSQYEKLKLYCNDYVQAAEDSTKTLHRFFAKTCKPTVNPYGSQAFRVLHACLANITDYPYNFFLSNTTDMLARTFLIPKCLWSDSFKDFSDACQNPNYKAYTNCESAVKDLPKSKFCHTYGLFRAGVLRRDYKFLAGIIVKTAREDFQRVPHEADELLKLLAEQSSMDDSQLECLLYGQAKNSSEICDEMNNAFFLENIRTLYRLKKQFIPPPSKVYHEKTEIVNANNIKQTMMNRYQYKMKNEGILNDYAAVMACKFGDKELTTDCNLFSTLYGTNGFVHAFNNEPFWHLFKNTTSSAAFYKEVYENTYQSEEKLPRKTVSTGQDHSLEFVIRHSPYTIRSDEHKSLKNYTQVFLSLHDPINLPTLKSEGILIKPGLSYEIRVSPTVTFTDESGMALDPKSRNCLARHESEKLKVFSAYTQSACLFECKLEYALKVCNCTAWDYPRIESSAKVCLPNGAEQCFAKVMKADAQFMECDCPNDCHHITYNVDVHVTTLLQAIYEDTRTIK